MTLKSNMYLTVALMAVYFSPLSGMDVKLESGQPIQIVIDQQSKTGRNSSFVSFESSDKFDEKYFDLGTIDNLKQYTSCFRNKSSWMNPDIGIELKDLPTETQFLLIEKIDETFLMIIPLVSNGVRSTLIGGPDNHLHLIAETGDTLTKVNEFLGLYLLSGNNPYDMIKQASDEIQKRLKTFKLRRDKITPWFSSHFGWCTWNALYNNLSHDTLVYAMENFREKDIPVRYMLIDAGWQSNTDNLLDSFKADKIKFPNGIGETIHLLKNEYGLDQVLMWQTLWGMFRGLHPESFIDNSLEVTFLSPGRFERKIDDQSSRDVEFEATVGPRFYPPLIGENLAIPADFVLYYNEYFDYLRKQGADGVKIDAMTWIEATGNNRGGRVKAMNDMMHGLQSAANIHFNNELINCSSCSNDYLFNTLTSNITRSSGDFFPTKPETHGFHIFTNAHTSFWMGEIIQPDWDMFQSGHESGAFHAAARAISGGPIYTTEEIGTEDKEVLSRLMTSTGTLPLCNDVGRVCGESLFTNPADNEKAVKIFNTNLLGGIVGAFNCSYSPDNNLPVKENIKASDIENLSGEIFAVYRFSDGSLNVKSKTDKIPVQLKEVEYDLFTYIPIENGFAPIGIIDKFNPAGMILSFEETLPGILTIKLMDGGNFLAYSEKKPKKVMLNSVSIEFNYNRKSNELSITIPKTEEPKLTVMF